jgi:HNH endonuclease
MAHGICVLCDAPAVGRGWCTKHYNRWRRHGDPLWEPPQYTLFERFWLKVKFDGPIPERCPELGPCWPWDAGITGAGYGLFSIPKPSGGFSSVCAHQFSYWLCVGDVPTPLELDHLCRNRWCVNPSHLEAVTHRENMLRSESPVAYNVIKTFCPQEHEYTEDNTIIKTDGSRVCKACNREQWHRWKERQSA